jgi:hypothetical protein
LKGKRAISSTLEGNAEGR